MFEVNISSEYEKFDVVTDINSGINFEIMLLILLE